MTQKINDDDIYYPLVWTPVGMVPLIGGTMTDEQERKLTERPAADRESEVSA